MTDYAVPLRHCPRCNTQLDHALELEDGHSPTPGDFSICIRCGEFLRFGIELDLRIASEKDLGDLPVKEVRRLKLAQRLIRNRQMLQGIN